MAQKWKLLFGASFSYCAATSSTKDIKQRPHIELFMNEEEFEKNFMITTLCTTYPKDPRGCYTTGHFSIKGFHFLVVESVDFSKTFAQEFTLPSHGFSEVITFEPQTITIRPEHVCVLPRIVIRALEFDSAVYFRMVQRVNGSFLATQFPAPGAPSLRVALPQHPLAPDPRALYQQTTTIMRLPDYLSFRANSDKTGQLVFTHPEKFEILSSQEVPSFQIWLIRNKPAKDVFAVINHFTSGSIVYGFSLNQEIFEKRHSEGLLSAQKSSHEALKGFLKLSPLSKTDHVGIESIADSPVNSRLIALVIQIFLKA